MKQSSEHTLTDPAINPYESPQGIELSVETAEDQMIPALRGPSMGLLLLAGMQSLNVLTIPIWLYQFFAGANVMEPALITLMSLPSIFICFAALRMRQMRSLRLCRVAAIMACIPFVTPTIVVGIPFGIWATVVLFRSSTAAAFERQSQE
ncbi:hypothetical protein [Anatilimnocola floriformis]|uniref:hypothetical protein n=1 Tax=Anatilimnocola floriformis TaxID=2948575 RepID=UPI0020C5ABE5|nr:hypothetical protein [Anatilimnocola floriformis]